MSRPRSPWYALMSGALAAALALTTPSAGAADRHDRPAAGTVNAAFALAAAEFGVPRDLLVAVGYGETHLDGHDGRPSHAGGYGVMHLVSNPERQTLELAADLTGETETGLPRAT